jgi:hypothetical protein
VGTARRSVSRVLVRCEGDHMNVWHANTRQEMRADLPAKVHRIASVRVVPVLPLLKTRSRRAVSEVTARKFSLMRRFDYGAVRSPVLVPRWRIRGAGKMHLNLERQDRHDPSYLST